MDLGRFEISKGPSEREGVDFGLFRKSKGPSGRGVMDLGLLGGDLLPSRSHQNPLEIA